MSYRETDFASEVALCCKIHYANPNQAAEMATIVTALGSDTTTHDSTIEGRSAALTVGPAQSRFQNDLLLLINQAKGGNLSNSQIIAGLDDALGVTHAPGLIDLPYASSNTTPPVVGSIASVTNGNWDGTPTSYAYQWTRNGSVIVGATAATYTLTSTDTSGNNKRLACIVTATNAIGSTAAPPSNDIVVTL